MSPLKKCLIAAILLVVAGGASLVAWRAYQLMGDWAPEPRPDPNILTTKAGNFAIGDRLPEFTLTDWDGNAVTSTSFAAGADYLVVATHHPDCPCARNCAKLINEMQQAGYDDVAVVGIMTQGARDEYDLKNLRDQIDEGTVTFPVYFDADESVAKMLGATRTPEVWILDKEGVIRFWGAPETTLFPGCQEHRYLLREAIDALRKGGTPEIASYQPIGCPIAFREELPGA